MVAASTQLKGIDAFDSPQTRASLNMLHEGHAGVAACEMEGILREENPLLNWEVRLVSAARLSALEELLATWSHSTDGCAVRSLWVDVGLSVMGCHADSQASLDSKLKESQSEVIGSARRAVLLATHAALSNGRTCSASTSRGILLLCSTGAKLRYSLYAIVTSYSGPSPCFTAPSVSQAVSNWTYSRIVSRRDWHIAATSFADMERRSRKIGCQKTAADLMHRFLKASAIRIPDLCAAGSQLLRRGHHAVQLAHEKLPRILDLLVAFPALSPTFEQLASAVPPWHACLRCLFFLVH